MRFHFNLLEHTLKLVHSDHSLVLTQPFYTLGGVGFTLDHLEPPNRWIIFSLKPKKVKAIYKSAGVYYRQELVRPTSNLVEIEFNA